MLICIAKMRILNEIIRWFVSFMYDHEILFFFRSMETRIAIYMTMGLIYALDETLDNNTSYGKSSIKQCVIYKVSHCI